MLNYVIGSFIGSFLGCWLSVKAAKKYLINQTLKAIREKQNANR